MTATYHPGVHKFSVFVVLWTIFLFVAGALVTSNDAALAVPDWPLSFHKYFPTMTGGVFYEHGHRMIAGVLAVLTLIQAILVWVKEERRWLRWFATMAVGGVVVQAILGGQVVIQLLHYWLPVIHACFAEIVFAAVLSIAVFTSRWWVSERPQIEDAGSPPMHTVAIVNSAVIYFQVILGAGFRHQEIPIWPHMAGALVEMCIRDSLTGVGPLLAWRKTSAESLRRNFAWPLGIGLIGGVLAFAFGFRQFYSLICLTLCVFVAATISMEFYRGAKVIRARSGASFLASGVDLTMRNTRRYGGYIVHMGMVLIFVGLAGVAFNKDVQKDMQPGQTMQIGQYTLRLQSVDSKPEKNYTCLLYTSRCV